jgi:pterin-4a-carbinolamine dehydratase
VKLQVTPIVTHSSKQVKFQVILLIRTFGFRDYKLRLTMQVRQASGRDSTPEGHHPPIKINHQVVGIQMNNMW